MRTNGRSLPALTTALLLAASAAAFSGCGKPDTVPVGPRTVIAVVTYKDGDPSAHMTVNPALSSDPKVIQLRESAGDKAWWLSPAGTIHMKWKGKKPFDRDPVDENGVLKSDRPSKGSSKVTNEGKCKDSNHECYEYEIELWLDTTGGKRVSVDPRIEVVE